VLGQDPLKTRRLPTALHVIVAHDLDA